METDSNLKAVIAEFLGDWGIALTRELTKVYEQIIRGRVSEILNQIGDKKLKGEITLVIEGKTCRKTDAVTR